MFLIAVNPYHWLPIYGDDQVQKARETALKDRANEPHIYTIAEQAYSQMKLNQSNQSILITGESGAGKTENTKKVLHYLASRATLSSSLLSASNPHLPRSEGDSSQCNATIDERILLLNPILEAFGNARTIRNNNSSRFGKFIKLSFDKAGCLVGAYLEQYLLEKSRVTHINAGERSFHIFYMFYFGSSQEYKAKLGLTSDEKFRMLDHFEGGKDEIQNLTTDFQDLVKSLERIGVTSLEIDSVFTIIVAIMYLGNIEFLGDLQDEALLSDSQVSVKAVQRICDLLQLEDANLLSDALLHPILKAGREVIASSKSVAQVRSSIETISRCLYERLFAYIVDKLNTCLALSSYKLSQDELLWIGVLDMAGFEIFPQNSFEQLCINFTNEKLQQFFNHTTFIKEQESYRSEGIQSWDYVDYGLDLQPTIDLIEKSAGEQIGILPLLDEECVMPKATDVTFTEKLAQIWRGQSGKYEVTKKNSNSKFTLLHYAGKVEYTTKGWIEKNKDPLNESLLNLFASSPLEICRILFPSSSSKEQSGSMFRTVSQKYKEQLNLLMHQLKLTDPHFVRCIVPNYSKKPKLIDPQLVMDQLACNGVIEGLRICRQGYPNRLDFLSFRGQYQLLFTHLKSNKSSIEALQTSKEACKMILEAFCHPSQYQIGHSKIFFRVGVLGELEFKRDAYVQAGFRAVILLSKTFLQMKNNLSDKKKSTFAKSFIEQDIVPRYIQLRTCSWMQLVVALRPFISLSKQEQKMKDHQQKINSLENQVLQLEDEKKTTQQIMTSQTDELQSLRQIVADYRVKLETTNNRNASLSYQLEELFTEKVQLQEKLAETFGNLDESEKLKVAAQDDLKIKEQELLAYKDDIVQLGRDKEELLLVQKQQQEQIDSLTQHSTTTLRQLADCEALIGQKDTQLTKLQEQSMDLEGEIDTMKNQLTLSGEKNKEISQKNEELTNLLTESQNANTELTNKLESAVLELEREKLSSQSLTTTVADMTLTFNNLQEEYKNLQEKFTLTEQLLSRKTADLDSIQQKFTCQESELHSYRDLLSQKDNIDQSLRQQLESLQVELTDVRAKQNLETANWNDEKLQLQKQYSVLEAQKVTLEEALSKTTQEVSDLKESKKELQLSMASMEEKLNMAKMELTSATNIHAELMKKYEPLEKEHVALKELQEKSRLTPSNNSVPLEATWRVWPLCLNNPSRSHPKT